MRERLTLTTKDQQRVMVVGRWVAGMLTTDEAVGLLGTSERTAWRLRGAFLRSGAGGLVHGNRGRPSPRRLDDVTRTRIVELARTTYRGFNDSHLTEVLATDEDITIGRSSLQRLLRREGLPSPRRRRPPRYRSRRARMSQAGLLVQIDGSRHDWLEGRGPELTLVGGIDDATGIVVGATFRDAEDGVGYMTILRDMARAHGLPSAIYRDRAGIFAPTRGTGRASPEATQVGRALAELGIASIAARSPQAKGRVERLWGTFQDRLVSELRRAGASDRAAANDVLPGFVARFNGRFGRPPELDTAAWRSAPPEVDLARICAFRWRRAVGNDNTVRLEGAVVQLPSMASRSLAGRRAELELRLEGRLVVLVDGRPVVVLPAPPEPRRLREVRLIQPEGPPPAPGGRVRPGYQPAAGHPWRRGCLKTAPSRRELTESLGR
jgi:transposase